MTPALQNALKLNQQYLAMVRQKVANPPADFAALQKLEHQIAAARDQFLQAIETLTPAEYRAMEAQLGWNKTR